MGDSYLSVRCPHGALRRPLVPLYACYFSTPIHRVARDPTLSMLPDVCRKSVSYPLHLQKISLSDTTTFLALKSRLVTEPFALRLAICEMATRTVQISNPSIVKLQLQLL